MAATRENPAPSEDELRPYIERIADINQVKPGVLVRVHPPYGDDKIQEVKGTHDGKGDPRGPSVDVGTYKVYLDSRKGGIMGKIELYRIPAEGGKRRRGKSRRSVRKSRKATRRRRA